jgi:hypothetical protein
LFNRRIHSSGSSSSSWSVATRGVIPADSAWYCSVRLRDHIDTGKELFQNVTAAAAVIHDSFAQIAVQMFEVVAYAMEIRDQLAG